MRVWGARGELDHKQSNQGAQVARLAPKRPVAVSGLPVRAEMIASKHCAILPSRTRRLPRLESQFNPAGNHISWFRLPAVAPLSMHPRGVQKEQHWSALSAVSGLLGSAETLDNNERASITEYKAHLDPDFVGSARYPNSDTQRSFSDFTIFGVQRGGHRDLADCFSSIARR